jgi:hypothetical protein
MILILGAYGLLSFEVILSTSHTYQLMNLIGAIGIAYISIKRKAYPPGVLNIIWALIALVAIIRILT